MNDGHVFGRQGKLHRLLLRPIEFSHESEFRQGPKTWLGFAEHYVAQVPQAAASGSNLSQSG